MSSTRGDDVVIFDGFIKQWAIPEKGGVVNETILCDPHRTSLDMTPPLRNLPERSPHNRSSVGSTHFPHGLIPLIALFTPTRPCYPATISRDNVDFQLVAKTTIPQDNLTCTQVQNLSLCRIRREAHKKDSPPRGSQYVDSKNKR